MFPRPEHGEPSKFVHGGGGGTAYAAGATAIAAATAPTNTMRIHVTEEARHIQFARDGLRKRTPTMGRFTKLWVSNINGLGGYFFRFLFTNRVPYYRVGLDADRARHLARTSPHRHEVQISGFAPLAAFIEEVGLMGRISRRMWRRTGFLPR